MSESATILVTATLAMTSLEDVAKRMLSERRLICGDGFMLIDEHRFRQLLGLRIVDVKFECN